MYFTKEDFQQIEAYFKVNAWKDTDFTRISASDMREGDIIAVVHDGTNCAIPYEEFINSIKSGTSQIIQVLSYDNLPEPGDGNNLYITTNDGALYLYNGNSYGRIGFPASSIGLGLKVYDDKSLDLNLQNDAVTNPNYYVIKIQDKDTKDTVLDITIPTASASYAGLMSAGDKIKLDSIPRDANNYTLKYIDFYEGSPHANTMEQIVDSDSIFWMYGIDGWEARVKTAQRDVIGGITVEGFIINRISDFYYTPLWLDSDTKRGTIMIPYVTSENSGIMTSADKTKLDSLTNEQFKYHTESGSFTPVNYMQDSASITWSTFTIPSGSVGLQASLTMADNQTLGGVKIPYSSGSNVVSINGKSFKGYHGLGYEYNEDTDSVDGLLGVLYDPEGMMLRNGGTQLALREASGNNVGGISGNNLERLRILADNIFNITVTGGQVQSGMAYTQFEYVARVNSNSLTYLSLIQAGTLKCKINIAALNIAGYPTTYEGYLYINNNIVQMLLTEYSIIKGSPVYAQLTFDNDYTEITNVTLTGI